MSETPTEVLIRAMAEANAAGIKGFMLSQGWVERRVDEMRLAQIEDALETMEMLRGDE